jgi:Rrf2 family protein
MFGLSTRGDYGLNFLEQLYKADGNLVSIKLIAQQRSLPLKYIERLATKLKLAGIIDSKEGARGGYKFARDPKSISVLDVVEVLEGDLSLTPCAKDGARACPRMDNCVMRGGWLEIQLEVREMLKNKTLKDLFNH